VDSTASRTRGEICFRGPNVMQGYWRNDKRRRRRSTPRLVPHGDVGFLDADGFLWITDRKKEILSSPTARRWRAAHRERLAAAAAHRSGHAGGRAPQLHLDLIVPDWAAIERFALRNGIAGDREALSHDQRVVSLVEAEVEAVNAKLSRYEQVKKFWIVPAEWTTESGELTPTLKLKRRLIQERFASSIEKLYPEAKR